MYFEYGENEILYLKSKDRKLAEVIEKIGLIKRETDTDLFSSVIHHIIGQQISTKAQAISQTFLKKFIVIHSIWMQSGKCQTRKLSGN